MFDVCRDFGARNVCRGESIPLISTMTKFCVDGGEDLFGSWRTRWEGETIHVVKLSIIVVEDGILGGGSDGRGERKGGGRSGRTAGIVLVASTSICLTKGIQIRSSRRHWVGESLRRTFLEKGRLCESHGGRGKGC